MDDALHLIVLSYRVIACLPAPTVVAAGTSTGHYGLLTVTPSSMEYTLIICLPLV